MKAVLVRTVNRVSAILVAIDGDFVSNSSERHCAGPSIAIEGSDEFVGHSLYVSMTGTSGHASNPCFLRSMTTATEYRIRYDAPLR